MSQKLSSNNGNSVRSIGVRRVKGFTLPEVLVAITVLAIGLLSVAAMVTSTVALGSRAEYMNMANVLASEKLDGLNKLPSTDPNMACTTVCGSLAGGASCGSSIYCDQVTVNQTGGADYETQTQIVNGSAVTTTIVHTAAGCVGTPAACGVAAPAGTGSTFTRRWMITYQPSISAVGGGPAVANGTKRVTVLVTYNPSIGNGNPVSFQISMVRP
jgi:type IV pilus modification protein PilV